MRFTLLATQFRDGFRAAAVNNTLHSIDDNVEIVIIRLQTASTIHFPLIPDKQMKPNEDKCHSICSRNEKVYLVAENQKLVVIRVNVCFLG